MAVFLSPVFNDTQFKSDGMLAVGYKIYTYAEGSSTPLATYTTSTGATPQANPIILNARGECTNQIWLTGGLGYKLVLTTDADVVVRTIDNIRGMNDTTVSVDQWQASGLTPTYISATSFSLVGDQTSAFHVGRRIKSTTSGGTIYSTITASVFGAVTTVTVVNDSGVLDAGLSAVSYALLTNANDSLPAIIDSNVQNQTATYYTTGGSSTAYTLTPIPAITTLATGHRFNVKFHATAGATPTLAISGLTAKSLKQYDYTGTKVAVTSLSLIANMIADVEYDGTDYVILNQLPTLLGEIKSFTAVANTPSNSVTITIPAGSLEFRSTTLTTGTPVQRTISSAISLVISSGSTLGATSGVASRIAVLAIDNAGTVEVAAVNINSGLALDEAALISTTAEGGAGGADNELVIYSTTARSNVAYRVIGYYDETQATAGTHSSALTLVQGVGGNIRLSPQREVLSTTTGGTSIDFSDLPSWTDEIDVMFDAVSTSGTSVLLVQIGGETTSYIGTASVIVSTVASATQTIGFGLNQSSVAAANYNGVVTLKRMRKDTNTWTSTGVLASPTSSINTNLSAGVKSLSGTLTTVRITTVNGTDTIDANTGLKVICRKSS